MSTQETDHSQKCAIALKMAKEILYPEGDGIEGSKTVTLVELVNLAKQLERMQ